MASNQHLETEIQLLTLKMPQTDFLKVRKCVFVEKKVTVVAAVDAISIYNLTAEKSCFAVKIWFWVQFNCFRTNNFEL